MPSGNRTRSFGGFPGRLRHETVTVIRSPPKDFWKKTHAKISPQPIVSACFPFSLSYSFPFYLSRFLYNSQSRSRVLSIRAHQTLNGHVNTICGPLRLTVVGAEGYCYPGITHLWYCRRSGIRRVSGCMGRCSCRQPIRLQNLHMNRAAGGRRNHKCSTSCGGRGRCIDRSSSRKASA